MDYLFSSLLMFLRRIFGLQQKPFFIRDQSFALPPPLIRQILGNAFANGNNIFLQLKLFKTCKLFRNHVRKSPEIQVDKLNLSQRIGIKTGIKYIYDKNSLHLRYNLFCDIISRKIFKIKSFKISTGIDKSDEEMLAKMCHSLDFSALENVKLDFYCLEEHLLAPFFVPSLITLKLLFEEPQNGNIFETVLAKLPNLRNFTLSSSTTSLKNAATIKRSTKLKVVRIYDVPNFPPTIDIANFIIHQMEPNGMLKFEGVYGSDIFEAPLEKENEILQLLQSNCSTKEFDQFKIKFLDFEAAAIEKQEKREALWRRVKNFPPKIVYSS